MLRRYIGTGTKINILSIPSGKRYYRVVVRNTKSVVKPAFKSWRCNLLVMWLGYFLSFRLFSSENDSKRLSTLGLVAGLNSEGLAQFRAQYMVAVMEPVV